MSYLHWLLVVSSLAFKYQDPRLVLYTIKACRTWSILVFKTYSKMRLAGIF